MRTATAATPARPPPRPKGQRDYLSLSAVRTYQECPLKYFFRYVAGLPEETVSASLVFGAAIHQAIEHHFRELLAGNAVPDLPALLEAYQASWAERELELVRFGKEETRASLDALAERMLGAFRNSTLAHPQGTILAVEEELRGAVIPGLPDLLGRVDLIVETPEAVVVSDWKTSRSKWSASQVEESAEQLLLYTELARDFAPGKPLRIEFSVLTKTKEVSVDRHGLAVDHARVDRTKRVIARIWNAIAGQHFYPAPSITGCGGCPFRQPCRDWRG
jgi:RecB family exonuclease